MVGVGIMAALDEIVFHQILSWHHFYGRSTPEVGLMADGLLHAGELILIVAGFFLIAVRSPYGLRGAGSSSARAAFSSSTASRTTRSSVSIRFVTMSKASFLTTSPGSAPQSSSFSSAWV